MKTTEAAELPQGIYRRLNMIEPMPDYPAREADMNRTGEGLRGCRG